MTPLTEADARRMVNADIAANHPSYGLIDVKPIRHPLFFAWFAAPSGPEEVYGGPTLWVVERETCELIVTGQGGMNRAEILDWITGRLHHRFVARRASDVEPNVIVDPSLDE